jgi:hypothetical protein
LKNDLENLFRDAGRITPAPELWRRIAERSSLAPGGEDSLAKGRLEAAAHRPEWMEVRYMRAAGVILAAGLLGLAAFGVLRHPPGGPREASTETVSEASSQGDGQVLDPELLGWLADLGDYELVADQAEEML